MLRVHEIKLSINEETALLPDKIKKRLNQPQLDIQSYSIFKESIDARNKEDIRFVYSVDFQVKDEKLLLKNAAKFRLEKVTVESAMGPTPIGISSGEKTQSMQNFSQNKDLSDGQEGMQPVVVGFGPCGMFAALRLAEMGYKPIVLERGKPLPERTKDVSDFWANGLLNPESNVAFGEGGAGAFSDGKLTTRIKDPHVRKVLQELVNAGGPADILYKQMPHIGTDVLRQVVMEIRERIIALGGEIRFNSRLTGIVSNEGHETHEDNEAHKTHEAQKKSTLVLKINDLDEISVSAMILAIGHSARDTFEMLYETGIHMAQKPFSIGLRVEHLQQVISEAQYGKNAQNSRLGPADYKLAHHCKNGRGVYTFCMCPGGLVIGAASEEACLVTNGMSYHSRAAENANSAILVDVRTTDFPSEHPLSGIAFQRQWEGQAFKMGGSSYKAPAQRMGDFLAGMSSESGGEDEGEIKASFRPGVLWTDISSCLPEFATSALREAIPVLAGKLAGFDDPQAVLTAVETRSSSPVRVLRDKNFCSSITGIYPAGEGAGYAGGIISAAVDGIRAAEAVHAALSSGPAK